MRNPALLSVFLAAASAAAQSNAVPGLDARIDALDTLTAVGRVGTFPDGVNGLAFAVHLCNTGNVPVDWYAPMDPRHPFPAFLVCRESDGRFEQISDRSYIKHGFGASNFSACGTCLQAGNTQLGPSCSDTYTVGNNADRFTLAPADELDPWLGAWDPVASHFDRGEPDVGPPQNADGIRSLTAQQVALMDPVYHRVAVRDADLAVAGARYYYGGFLVIRGEADAARTDTMASREAMPQWSNGAWTFADLAPAVSGSILQRWSGSALDSSSNGADDGRFYVAVRVTGPDGFGFWHYEYAVHNRDNGRGAAALHIPMCSAARVFNARARDVDADPANDWTAVIGNGEIAFVAGPGNALAWNTIFNFSFDSDAAPAAGAVALDQARPGPGAPSVVVGSSTPTLLYNEFVAGGCGGALLSAVGAPPRATIPNPVFGLWLQGVAPNAAAALLGSATVSVRSLGSGCTLLGGDPLVSVPLSPADAAGNTGLLLPVPNIPALEGGDLVLQGIAVRTGGPLFGALDLSNGVRVRVGNAIPGCR